MERTDVLPTFIQHSRKCKIPIFKIKRKQECILVGCVPPAHWPYLVVSYACPPCHHACPPTTTDTTLPPCTPPTTAHAPCHHAHPLPSHMPPTTMHAPATTHPPTTTHAPHHHTTPSAMHASPLWTDRHLQKHNLCKLRLWVVKMRACFLSSRCGSRIWSRGAAGSETESCRCSEAKSCERSEQIATGVQGPLKGPGSFWVFNAQICILPHSRDSFSLIFDIYFNTKSW